MAFVKIPTSTTVINDYTFEGCTNLTEVVLHSEITEIGQMAFLKCEKLESVTIPSKLTTIKAGAFTRCNLKSITLPNSITKIESTAFATNKNLTDVHITSQCRIGISAFINCSSLSKVYCNVNQPPYLESSNVFSGTSETLTIYVPMASVDAYKTANGWKDLADKIVGYEF